MDIDYMIAMFAPKQDKVFMDVRKSMKEIKCFELEGVIFRGNPHHVALEFAHNNPDGGDFYVWVQKNYEIISLVK